MSMEQLDPKFCLVPFTSFSISPRGILRTCCVQYNTGMHKWENIKDIGQIPWPTKSMVGMQEKMLGPDIEKNATECQFCWAQETLNQPSYRTKHNEYWFRKLGETGVQELIKNPKITTLDLQFGHLCNNSCVMCNTSLSSHLYTTKNRLFNQTTDQEQKAFYDFDLNYIKDHSDWTLNEHSYAKVLELCKPITEIKISGGEPMFNPKFVDFIEFLVTKDQPLERINLTTNGTVYDEKLIELINRIKQIGHLKISVESLGKEEEFIRWPTVWTDKVQNIRKFIENISIPEQSFEISSCIQSLNLLSLVKVQKFVDELKRVYPDKNIFISRQLVGKGDIASSLHSDNEYLDYYLSAVTPGSGYDDVIKHINMAKAYTEKRTRTQVLYYTDLARLQGIDFAKTFPVYWEYHKKYL